MRTIELYIGGEFCAGSSAQSFLSINPATEQAIAQVASASAADVERAVGAARTAFDSGEWGALPAAQRAEYLRAVADLLEARSGELAELETHDTGMTLTMTRGGHVPRAIAHFRYFAAEAERMCGEVYPMDGAYLNFVSQEPLGVAAVFAPWNAPLAVATINVAAALAFGNTCVLKASENTPLTASLLAEAFHEAGVPPGVFNLLQGPGEPTGAALAASREVNVISFVGGTATGKKIMSVAAERLTRIGLELGGKSPAIVFADADLEAALDGILLAAFSSNGEVCTAASRILVHEDVYEAFLERFVERVKAIRVGDPMDPVSEMGPLISAAHRERVESYLASAIHEGARLCCGGGRAGEIGYYLRPAVVAGVNNSMKIAREEVFGPVAALMPFREDEEAIELANDSEYGLAAYLWTANTSKALAAARRLRCGGIAINSPLIRDIRAPFGGVRASGLGRVGGHYSRSLFTEVKTTCLPVTPYTLPRLGKRAT